MSETKKSVAAVYPAVPSSIREIDKAYIHTFVNEKYAAHEITKEDVKVLAAEKEKLVKEKGVARYFIPYRKFFAKKFFPNLVKDENASDKYNLDDLFAKILAE